MNNAQQFKALLEPGLRKIFYDGYEEEPQIFEQVMSVQTSNKHTETFYRMAGLTAWEPFNGAVVYEDLTPGQKYYVSHVTYVKGMQIPYELAEDDLYGVIGNGGKGVGGVKARNLGRGARIVAEQLAAKVFNDAFTVPGYDGVPMCSDSHPLLKPNAVTGETKVSNIITDPLSDTGLKNAYTLLRQQVADDGVPLQAKGDTLLVPVGLEFTALELQQSAQMINTNYNNKNIAGSRIKKVVVWEYLTDPNNWFLLDSNYLDNRIFFWRVKPEFKSADDIDHLTLKFVGRMRASTLVADWRGIVGANVPG